MVQRCCSHFNWLLAPQPRLNGESFRDLSLSQRIVGCRCRRNCIPVSIQWLVWVRDGARVSLSLSWQWKLIPLPLVPFWTPLQHWLIRGHHETSRKLRSTASVAKIHTHINCTHTNIQNMLRRCWSKYMNQHISEKVYPRKHISVCCRRSCLVLVYCNIEVHSTSLKNNWLCGPYAVSDAVGVTQQEARKQGIAVVLEQQLQDWNLLTFTNGEIWTGRPHFALGALEHSSSYIFIHLVSSFWSWRLAYLVTRLWHIGAFIFPFHLLCILLSHW